MTTPVAEEMILSLQVSSAELVFEGKFAADRIYGRMYNISPKGDFFIMIEQEEPQPATQINIVLKWSEELKRLSGGQAVAWLGLPLPEISSSRR